MGFRVGFRDSRWDSPEFPFWSEIQGFRGIQGFILEIQGFTDGIQGFTVGIQEYLQNFSFRQGIQGFTDSLLGFRDLGRSEILNSRPVHTYTRKTLYLRMHTCEIAYT